MEISWLSPIHTLSFVSQSYHRICKPDFFEIQLENRFQWCISWHLIQESNMQLVKPCNVFYSVQISSPSAFLLCTVRVADVDAAFRKVVRPAVDICRYPLLSWIAFLISGNNDQILLRHNFSPPKFLQLVISLLLNFFNWSCCMYAWFLILLT